MKGFVEINVVIAGASLLSLININTIECVTNNNGRAIIYSSVVETDGNCIEQIRYLTQNTYEEVKAMIEEAMK